ncbi:hypothetical protein ALIPUT_01665 [Alistipes putredinis DSM 17216]|uniref:Uncharacterized protein n=1 Tax=Alistipes putredinis DSM 17216 TaxID=445970 RepID=B0MXC6_9BACT|nr:hypothetical protein ALIPUT_01665 [Alistipes putredinis DSM 17216]
MGAGCAHLILFRSGDAASEGFPNSRDAFSTGVQRLFVCGQAMFRHPADVSVTAVKGSGSYRRYAARIMGYK